MIEVIYYRGQDRVTIRGHAHSGELGRDLICAGCSALVLTLAANVRHLEEQGHVRNTVVRIQSGDAEISCTPRSGCRHTVRLIFQSLCAGFELLANQYKDFICYEVHG